MSTNPNASENVNINEDAAMNDASQGGSASATGSSGAVDPPAAHTNSAHSHEEEVDFESKDFAVPPSFGQELSEESLKTEATPYVLWANLKIPAPAKPGNTADAMFDCLADFIEAAADKDKQFWVFSYHLS